MRKTGQRMSCQAVNRDKLIEGLSFKILRDGLNMEIFDPLPSKFKKRPPSDRSSHPSGMLPFVYMATREHLNGFLSVWEPLAR
jgi:hypothetical protein